MLLQRPSADRDVFAPERSQGLYSQRVSGGAPDLPANPLKSEFYKIQHHPVRRDYGYLPPVTRFKAIRGIARAPTSLSAHGHRGEVPVSRLSFDEFFELMDSFGNQSSARSTSVRMS